MQNKDVWGESKFNFHLAVTANTLQVRCDKHLLLLPIAARCHSLWRSRFCEVKTLQWKIVALKVEAQDRLRKLTLKAEVAHEDWPYLRALWSSAVKGESQQHHVHPSISLTNDDSRPPLIFFLSSVEWVLSSNLQLLVFRTLMTHTVVLIGSMVPLLHINIKCQAWNRATQYSPPHPINKTCLQFSANVCSMAIYTLLASLHRCKHFHTLSQRLQSANTFSMT